MGISVNRRNILILYCIVGAANLLFIAFSSPTLSPQPTGLVQPDVLASFVLSNLDLRREGVIATWYSSMLFFVTGLAALVGSRVTNQSIVLKTGWTLAALVFIALSADEVAQVHEQLAPLLNVLNRGMPGRPYEVGAGDWIPILMPAIVAIGLGLTAFLWAAFKHHRRSLITSLAGLICWAGVIVAESVESGRLQVAMSRGVEGFIEESLEIVGTTCFLVSFVEFLWVSMNGRVERD